MDNNKRRWKQTVDAALSPARFPDERDRVALQIGAHLAGWSCSGDHGLGTLQGRVVSLVEDPWIRASLAARHLDALHDSLLTADYEDLQALREELSWTEAYLAPALDGLVSRRGEQGAGYADRLFAHFATRLAPRLEIAAA